MVSADYEKSCQEQYLLQNQKCKSKLKHIKMSQWNKSQWWQETK